MAMYDDPEKPPESTDEPPATAGSAPRSPSTTSLHTDADCETLDSAGPHDESHPNNWPRSRKWVVAGAAMLGSLILPLNGTSITVAREAINAEFGIDDSRFPNSYWAVTSWSLGGSLFIIVGLPLMEDLGVRAGYNIFYALFYLMLIPQALARNFATLVVTRFFAGGCVALLANTIASIIPDLWADDRDRSLPVALYILLYITGSSLGPPLFAPVAQHLADWRWIFYIQLILYGAAFPLFLLLIRETRAPVLLRRRRAKALRRHHRAGRPVFARDGHNNNNSSGKSSSSGSTDRIALDLNTAGISHTSPRALLRSITRPLYLLATEPVLLASTLWSAFSFGTVFLFTQSVEQVFTGLYGWPSYRTGYVQAAVVVGEALGFCGALYGSRLYLASAKDNPERPGRPVPEARLYVSVIGSFVGMSGGMFVYAWTSYPTLPWIAPAVGLGMVGCGIQIVVTAVADYVVDAYAESDYAGSAISAVAAVENVVAALLPLSAQRMYSELGFRWASTLLGFLALGLSFAPVVFIWKGRWFRERSPFMEAGNPNRRRGVEKS